MYKYKIHFGICSRFSYVFFLHSGPFLHQAPYLVGNNKWDTRRVLTVPNLFPTVPQELFR